MSIAYEDKIHVENTGLRDICDNAIHDGFATEFA
jgi:hypothetical protein